MTYSIVDGLGLLDDDEVLGGGLEGVREGSLGSLKARSQVSFRPDASL